jgi:hypothetical protein
MAVFSAILCPSSAPVQKVAALAATTSSAELAFGNNTIIAVNATQDITIAFGQAGMGAATASNFRIPANTTQTFDLGQTFSSIRVFNLAASAADVYVQPLSRF